MTTTRALLCLISNKFQGPIPAEVSKLTSLMIMEAPDNMLEGELPALPRHLVKCHLQGNRLAR